MKKNIFSIVALVAMVGLPMGVMSQEPATISNTAKATVVTPIKVTAASTGLQFGSFSAGANGGTVLLTPTSATAAGNRIAGGTVDLLSSGETPTCALYTLSGETGKTFDVTLPTDVCTLSTSATGNGTKTMTIAAADFSIFLDALGDTQSTIAANSAFAIGAKLNVASDQVPGAYEGTFSITVAYN